MAEDRYDRFHSYGDVHFYLSSYDLNIEEARFILLKIVEQAIRDYVSLFNSELATEQQYWETAKDFIFDDEYTIAWGEVDLTFESVLNILDLDVSWVRKETREKFKERYGSRDQG